MSNKLSWCAGVKGGPPFESRNVALVKDDKKGAMLVAKTNFLPGEVVFNSEAIGYTRVAKTTDGAVLERPAWVADQIGKDLPSSVSTEIFRLVWAVVRAAEELGLPPDWYVGLAQGEGRGLTTEMLKDFQKTTSISRRRAEPLARVLSECSCEIVFTRIGSSGGAFCSAIAFLNHSCNPNVQITATAKTVRAIVVRPIEAGEEVTINYYRRPDSVRNCFCDECKGEKEWGKPGPAVELGSVILKATAAETPGKLFDYVFDILQKWRDLTLAEHILAVQTVFPFFLSTCSALRESPNVQSDSVPVSAVCAIVETGAVVMGCTVEEYFAMCLIATETVTEKTIDIIKPLIDKKSG